VQDLSTVTSRKIQYLVQQHWPPSKTPSFKYSTTAAGTIWRIGFIAQMTFALAQLDQYRRQKLQLSISDNAVKSRKRIENKQA
jgi:ABC-type cobalamin transport system ATPase subunit